MDITLQKNTFVILNPSIHKKQTKRLSLIKFRISIKGVNFKCLYVQQQIKIILPLLQIIQKMTSQAKQVYPQDWSCIIDPVDGHGGLYIGNLQAAQNLSTLKKLQIRAVLTAAKGVEISHPKNDIPYSLYVPAEDHQSFDISRYFHQAAAFIHDCLQRTNIMVHCLAGVSRSVSLSIAFLIKHKGMAYKEAYALIKGRRKIIHPNDGFIEQLKKFQRDLPPVREQCKSLSPKKTFQKDYSIQSYSPSKQNNRMDINSIMQRYESFQATPSPSKFRNPQSQYEIKQEPYSPQKSAHRLKRFVSTNVDADIFSHRQSIVENNIPTRPFGNAQNRYSDIDKRIEEIRKKYQEYAPTVSPNVGLNNKYNNYVGENAVRGRTSSGYAAYNNNSAKDYDQNRGDYVYSNRTWVQNGRQYTGGRQYGQTITQNIRQYAQNPREYGQNSRQYGQQSRQNWQNSRQYGQFSDLKASKIKRITSFQQY